MKYNMGPKISYAICTHNEGKEYLTPLLNKLLTLKDPEDEIVVVDDYSDNPETLEVLEAYNSNIKLFKHALNKDFASHKNYLKDQCTGHYIFNIDADEMPHDNLLKCLKEILIDNDQVDLFSVPRINLVPGLTPTHVQKWGWRVDDRGRVNYPDYQNRIFKNIPGIVWKNKVHEVITGHTSHAALPDQTEDYCLIHIKDIKRQETQNSFYETI